MDSITLKPQFTKLLENRDVIKVVRVFSPAPVSGFFSPVITDDTFTTGAKGGGVTIDRGVNLWLLIEEAQKNFSENYINGIRIHNSIAEYVLNRLVTNGLNNLGIRIFQEIDVPISSGFGTSAASAYAMAIAVDRAFNLNRTSLELAQIAHEADLKFRTGLGSVAGLVSPGFMVIERAGAPGYVKIRKIVAEKDYTVFAVWRSGMDKKKLLTNMKRLDEIALIGDRALENILADLTPETFFRECWRFTLNAGLASEWVKIMVNRISKVEGVVGVTQTQIGEAIFGMIDPQYKEYLEKILRGGNGVHSYFYSKVYSNQELFIEEIKL
jgi:pantoate kinase